MHEYFFVVEPQASVIVHFTRWARLDLGVGYRLTAVPEECAAVVAFLKSIDAVSAPIP